MGKTIALTFDLGMSFSRTLKMHQNVRLPSYDACCSCLGARFEFKGKHRATCSSSGGRNFFWYGDGQHTTKPHHSLRLENTRMVRLGLPQAWDLV